MKNRIQLALLGLAKMFSGIAAMGLLLFGAPTAGASASSYQTDSE